MTDAIRESQAGHRAAGSPDEPAGTTPRMSDRQAGHVTVSYNGCGQSSALTVGSGTRRRSKRGQEKLLVEPTTVARASR